MCNIKCLIIFTKKWLTIAQRTFKIQLNSWELINVIISFCYNHANSRGIGIVLSLNENFGLGLY